MMTYLYPYALIKTGKYTIYFLYQFIFSIYVPIFLIIYIVFFLYSSHNFLCINANSRKNKFPPYIKTTSSEPQVFVKTENDTKNFEEIALLLTGFSLNIHTSPFFWYFSLNANSNNFNDWHRFTLNLSKLWSILNLK